MRFRERDMDASLIVQMDGKKTRLHKPKHNVMDSNNAAALAARENYHDFTFDHSYWSFEGGSSHEPVVTQEEVYNDLGMDVINSAFQGMFIVRMREIQYCAAKRMNLLHTNCGFAFLRFFLFNNSNAQMSSILSRL